jgi:hypothetical protein
VVNTWWERIKRGIIITSHLWSFRWRISFWMNEVSLPFLALGWEVPPFGNKSWLVRDGTELCCYLIFFHRPSETNWLWYVPPPVPGSPSLYYLWYSSIHGWERLKLVGKYWSGGLPKNVNDIQSIFHIFSPRGLEWWAIQPCCWLVVPGCLAFLFGNWEGERMIVVLGREGSFALWWEEGRPWKVLPCSHLLPL